MEVNDFAIKFHVRSKVDVFDWTLVAIYGAAQPKKKTAFLAEFVRICVDDNLPILVGLILALFLYETRRIMIISMVDDHLC